LTSCIYGDKGIKEMKGIMKEKNNKKEREKYGKKGREME
jgi:hypothetical protein